MADNKHESAGKTAQGNAAKTVEGGQPQPSSDVGTEPPKGGGDDKARLLGGKPGLGEYGRPNNADSAGE